MIPLFKVAMSRSAGQKVAETLGSGYIGQGPAVERFEEILYELTGERVLTTNSCTSALDLALELIGVGPGDRVITTPMTCTATNSPIVKRGAIPVWADVDTEGLISPDSVRSRLFQYPDAKAVMAVDWAGKQCDWKGLRKAAPGVPIIEDAAHRFPSPDFGGDYVAWSFQAIKFLTTGDGGALLTPQSQYHRAKLLRWYGLDRESSADFRCAQDIKEVGFKYHMNDIAATIGLSNFRQAARNSSMHKFNAHRLATLMDMDFDVDHHYWFFPLTVEHRDVFIAYMAMTGIATSQVHARNDKHTGFNYPGFELPGIDWFDSHQVAIPCGWWLTQKEVEHIAKSALAFSV